MSEQIKKKYYLYLSTALILFFLIKNTFSYIDSKIHTPYVGVYLNNYNYAKRDNIELLYLDGNGQVLCKTSQLSPINTITIDFYAPEEYQHRLSKIEVLTKNIFPYFVKKNFYSYKKGII